MQWLANWSMQSQRRAMIAIALSCLVPLLFWAGAALSALVVLRQGLQGGLKVILWGSLPAVGWWAAGDPKVLITLALAVMAATVLRTTFRLDWALCAVGLICLLGYFVTPVLYSDVLALLVERGQELVVQGSQLEPQATSLILEMMQPVMQGILASLHALLAVLCLFLGRYWHSCLDHPGGFGNEFRQLRLPLFYNVPVTLATLGIGAVQPEIAFIFMAATMPVILAGLAIIHGVVKQRNAGTQWLVLTYLGCAFAGAYMYTLLIFVATLDSFIDIRSRLKDTA